MRYVTRWWAVGLLLAFCAPAWADNVNYQSIAEAAQKTNDLSRQAMVMIFGEVVLDPLHVGQPTLIGALFGLINGGRLRKRKIKHVKPIAAVAMA